MKLSLINESLTSEEMQILDAWNRGEIEKGDNLYDSAQDLFKKLGTQVMLSESALNFQYGYNNQLTDVV
jgi:hypothetical protein